MVGFFQGLNEIQETYNTFECQFEPLYHPSQKKKEATKSYDDMVDWQRCIKDKPKDVPILYNIKLRRIKISLESWENVCESVESTIQNGQRAYKKRWFTSENLLIFLDLPLMDPIEYSLPPKINLEKV